MVGEKLKLLGENLSNKVNQIKKINYEWKANAKKVN